jgi:hypothetical protein
MAPGMIKPARINELNNLFLASLELTLFVFFMAFPLQELASGHACCTIRYAGCVPELFNHEKQYVTTTRQLPSQKRAPIACVTANRCTAWVRSLIRIRAMIEKVVRN